MQTLRDYLSTTALFLEGVENLKQDQLVNVYCGLNVSKTDEEPLDQLVFFIMAKRIQEWNLKRYKNPGKLIIYIAGLYEVFNCQNQDECRKLIKINQKKEIQKIKLFQKIINCFQLKAKILSTNDLWQDKDYWTILEGLFDKKIFSRGLLINDTLKFYQDKNQLFNCLRMKQLPRNIVNYPLKFLKKIGNYPAPILYIPAEVTEAYYLQKKFSINTKIGQAQERVYDKYLYNDFSVYRSRQSVCLKSSLIKPRVVTPYINKTSNKNLLRINFNDDLKEIEKKIKLSNDDEYAVTYSEQDGELLNPLLEKNILVIESFRAMKKKMVIADKIYLEGIDLFRAVLERNISIKEIKSVLPPLIYQLIKKLSS